MSEKNTLAYSLIIISLALLVPGVTQPMATITAEMSILGFDKELMNEKKSILETITSLYKSNYAFVASLILLFSMIIPLLKAGLLLFVLKTKKFENKYKIYNFVRGISKWSMADVFVVGIFITYLTTKASDNMDGQLEIGFYFFAAYCLVSLFSLHFIKVKEY